MTIYKYPLALVQANCLRCAVFLEHLPIDSQFALFTLRYIHSKYATEPVQNSLVEHCLRCAVFLEHLPQQTGPRDTSWLTR